jgi:hypothetical protein
VVLVVDQVGVTQVLLEMCQELHHRKVIMGETVVQARQIMVAAVAVVLVQLAVMESLRLVEQVEQELHHHYLAPQ